MKNYLKIVFLILRKLGKQCFNLGDELPTQCLLDLCKNFLGKKEYLSKGTDIHNI